jgi:hypothetical protein
MPKHTGKNKTAKIVAAILCVSGAGCGQSPTTTPFQPTSFPAASATAAIVPGGGSLSFPAAGGYAASFVYSANNAVGVTATLTTLPPPPVSGAPPGTELAAFELTLSGSVTFAQWSELPSSIMIPPVVPTAGHSFGAYGYDLTTGVAEGWNPGTVAGTTITFGPGLGPVTLTGHTYLMILAMNNASAPVIGGIVAQ